MALNFIDVEKMILVIDNYDSFVYNLARYVNELGKQTIVKRNDAISIKEIEYLTPSHIIISPGPCTPNEAGISLELIKKFHKTIPILGVCLGHQAIGQSFGGNIIRSNKPMHGKSSVIMHDSKNIFKNIKNPLTVGRYHSLCIDRNNFPDCLEINATSIDSDIMAVTHKKYPVFGVQFHPESILTECGYDLLSNFLNIF